MKLAIIGAGVAGLAAARALRQRQPELEITIYEQGSTLGGRVATGRRDGFVFDHGAQNMRTPTPEIERLLTADLPAADLIDIRLPVWVFDGAGAIAAGDPVQNAEPKWTYRDGLIHLADLLGEGLEIRYDLRIASLGRRTTDDRRPIASLPNSSVAGGRWSVVDSKGQTIAEADLVLLTPPAPQAADILAASDLDPGTKAALLAELRRASYRRCISLALAYDRTIARPFYALVNIDRAHPIAWLALEHTKAPERCPPGHSLLIAQMGARWSLAHWDMPAEQLAPLVAEQAGALLGVDARAPLWCDIERWPYALPDSGADFDLLNDSRSGLFFAGDYMSMPGRLHLAIESGWRVAAAIERALTK